MRYFDVFNGDADGICSLHQLRLADPLESTLVTGFKRDIALLDQVEAGEGDVITVLDVSLDRNRGALLRVLERGAIVHYFDHHDSGPVPQHPRLLTLLDASGAACTSSLIDRYLRGAYRPWAVVGAFGDGLDETAVTLAKGLDIDAARLGHLRTLGVSLNYGAYGQSESDVLVLPVDLYRVVSHYEDPFELIEREPVIGKLADERHADLERARELRPLRNGAFSDAWVLPDAPWARRVIGEFANRLASSEPHRAHAVLAPRSSGGYLVSVRAPRGEGHSAAAFCRGFPTGGGRTAAAGIDRLEESRLDAFLDALDRAWEGVPAHA